MVAGALSVGAHRHGGQEETVNNIISFLLCTGLLVAGSFNTQHGPVGYTGGARRTGACEDSKNITQDEYGMLGTAILGERIGQTAAQLKLGSQGLMI